jgi:hypothetical protein
VQVFIIIFIFFHFYHIYRIFFFEGGECKLHDCAVPLNNTKDNCETKENCAYNETMDNNKHCVVDPCVGTIDENLCNKVLSYFILFAYSIK